jgi:hypothetical protein
LWSLPPSLLTSDAVTNRWVNELTLQVLKTTARYAAFAIAIFWRENSPNVMPTIYANCQLLQQPGANRKRLNRLPYCTIELLDKLDRLIVY